MSLPLLCMFTNLLFREETPWITNSREKNVGKPMGCFDGKSVNWLVQIA